MLPTRLLCATVILLVVTACATPLPSAELDPAFPTNGLSVDQALEVARAYEPSRGPETVLLLQGGRFKDLITEPYPDSLQWVLVVRMQGSYSRNCQRARMETPPPCPDVHYKIVAMDYHSGDVLQAQFGNDTEW